MQPIVHLAVGYLCYVVYSRWAGEYPPAGGPVLLAVFAAVLPDLVDKPLAAAGVVPVGRTIGHSLLLAVPLMVAVWLAARRIERDDLGVAFGIGYASHLASDVPWHVLSGDYHELGFLLWPITTMPPYTGVKSVGTVAGVEVTTLWFEAVLLLAGIIVWWRDGRPGLGLLRQMLPT